MTKPDPSFGPRFRRAVTLTLAGLWAERITQAFWPLWSVIFACLSVLMMGGYETAPVELFWLAMLVATSAFVWAVIRGVLMFCIPRRSEALARIDATLPNRPIAAVVDHQATGADDQASQTLWRAHQARMTKQLATVEAVHPDLRVAKRDPFSLRYVAVLALGVALLFGSFTRLQSVSYFPNGSGAPLASAASWDGWVLPPDYTGLPSLYLADLKSDRIELPQGSKVVLRFYGEVGDLTLDETVSGRVDNVPPVWEPEQEFAITQSGRLAIQGREGREWDVVMKADTPPNVQLSGDPEATGEGVMRFPFSASDDYGIAKGEAIITLDMPSVPRQYGLTLSPEPRPDITLSLPLPVAGDRGQFDETLVENLSQHPWAHLPVRMTLRVVDDLGQTAVTQPALFDLPAKRFFDPLAAVLVEQRRDLLWTSKNAPRVARLLRAITYRPDDDLFPKKAEYLQLRTIIRRLEDEMAQGLSPDARDEIAQSLWDLALELEGGDIQNALERMQRAQEQLQQAMKNGASDEEIARLMQELRDASRDYMRLLAQQQQDDGQADQNGASSPDDAITMTQDDIQRMMDRIQELMEQGRMAEAQQALEEFRSFLDNLQFSQGQGGRGPSQGQQALDDLANTLRNQQGLSEDVFRDLQNRFDPNPSQEGDATTNESPADRQRALRDQLERQRQGLPFLGGEEGQSARDALERAERSMKQAEDALRENDLSGAIDQQAEALNALRDGIRDMNDALAAQNGANRGSASRDQDQSQGGQQDPLGRRQGQAGGTVDGDNTDLNGQDVYRRARDLLDEIRKRSGEADRPDQERSYLKRLLDRF